MYCRGGDEFLCLWVFISPGSGLCQNMTKLKHGSHFLSRCSRSYTHTGGTPGKIQSLRTANREYSSIFIVCPQPLCRGCIVSMQMCCNPPPPGIGLLNGQWLVRAGAGGSVCIRLENWALLRIQTLPRSRIKYRIQMWCYV